MANAVVDHRVLIVAVLRHDPYDIGRQSVRLHARRQPSADVDLDIEVLVPAIVLNLKLWPLLTA